MRVNQPRIHSQYQPRDNTWERRHVLQASQQWNQLWLQGFQLQSSNMHLSTLQPEIAQPKLSQPQLPLLRRKAAPEYWLLIKDYRIRNGPNKAALLSSPSCKSSRLDLAARAWRHQRVAISRARNILDTAPPETHQAICHQHWARSSTLSISCNNSNKTKLNPQITIPICKLSSRVFRNKSSRWISWWHKSEKVSGNQ